MLTLIAWLRLCLSEFSAMKRQPFINQTFRLSMNFCCWKKFTMHSPRLSIGKLCSTSLKAEYLHILSEILLHGRSIHSPPLSYLFNHLFISVWTHAYLFYTLGYTLTMHYFIAQILPALALGSSHS